MKYEERKALHEILDLMVKEVGRPAREQAGRHEAEALVREIQIAREIAHSWWPKDTACAVCNLDWQNFGAIVFMGLNTHVDMVDQMSRENMVRHLANHAAAMARAGAFGAGQGSAWAPSLVTLGILRHKAEEIADLQKESRP